MKLESRLQDHDEQSFLSLGFVRKVVVAKIAAMTGWRPVWQGVTNFLMRHGS